MQRNVKVSKRTQNKPTNHVIKHPFDYAELRHELYMWLPAVTTGKLSLLSHQWQTTTLYEKIDAKKLVLQLIYSCVNANPNDPECEYNQLSKKLLKKNKAILELKTKETTNRWEKLLAHLIFDKSITSEDIIKLLPEFELDQIIRLGYVLDFDIFSSDNLWDKVVIYFLSAFSHRKAKSNVEKIEVIINELKKIEDDRLANFLITSFLPRSYALKKDWETFKRTQTITIYRNLVSIKFINANLENINLCSSDLFYSDFTKANIKNGLFIQSFCYNVDFTETLAENSKFISANLYSVNAQNANFNNADFTRAKMKYATFKHATLSNALMMYVTAKYSNFTKALLCKSNLSHANFNFALMSLANFSDAILIGASFWHARMYRADFANTILDGASFCGADLRECILKGVSCKRTLFFGAKLMDDAKEYLRKNGAYVTLADVIQVTTDDEITGSLFAEKLRLHIAEYIELISPRDFIPILHYLKIIETIKEYKTDDATIKKLADWLHRHRPNARFRKPATKPMSYCLIQEIHEAYVMLEKRRQVLVDQMDIVSTLR